ncbi:hypothetical protein OUZ56_012480 [Daphnia magna]|uniref:Uncharacterized protein n=1 Tax=Daphnia magna TaxID=35525 RepID=A0ABQ9Z352_9CRUS|nr:hypothetical protein OUZ56_012480 [Daphnia magna]
MKITGSIQQGNGEMELVNFLMSSGLDFVENRTSRILSFNFRSLKRSKAILTSVRRTSDNLFVFCSTSFMEQKIVLVQKKKLSLRCGNPMIETHNSYVSLLSKKSSQ